MGRKTIAVSLDWVGGGAVSKLGMGLYASAVDWPSLMAVRPVGLVAIDAYHLPPYPSGGCEYIWRPWITPDFRLLTPWEWRWYALHEWEQKGRPHFDGLQFMNEPWIDSPGVTAAEIVAWGQELVGIIRHHTWPGAKIYAPPLSPTWPDYAAKWNSLRPLVEQCDALAVHAYLDDPYSYRQVWAQYPLLPMIITECGRPGWGTAEYGHELVDYARAVDEYVRWVAPFVWQQVPEFAAWGLEGTPAAAVLAREAG